ncbi:MAG: hypothetical protein VX112_05485 [Pseudomonadota bacterium]|nr:hypothetical protein [Pseudomonadota bacterium]
MKEKCPQTSIHDFITEEVDSALRGVKSYEVIRVDKKDLSILGKQASLERYALKYDLNFNLENNISLEKMKSIKAEKCEWDVPTDWRISCLEEMCPSSVDYKRFLQNEISRIIETEKEVHQLILVEQQALVEHILGHIILKIDQTAHNIVYRKASTESPKESFIKHRDRIFQALLSQPNHVLEIERLVRPFFQPGEYHKVKPEHEGCAKIMHGSWLETKKNMGIKNHKKANVHFFHALMQPLSLALIIISGYFNTLWHVTLASYLACTAFLLPKPLEPIKFMGKVLSKDRILTSSILFILICSGNWALFTFTPGLSTLLSIKITTCFGLFYMAIYKLVQTAKEVLSNDRSFLYKICIITGELTLNLTVIGCIIATFFSSEYLIINEALIAWYSIDMCLGSINTIPNLSDKNTTRLLWSALTLSTAILVSAAILAKISLMDMYIALTIAFTVITRIACSKNIQPDLHHTCARHTSYLWLCWLTIENKLKLTPTFIGLYISLAVELIFCAIDIRKNVDWDKILRFKTNMIEDSLKLRPQNISNRKTSANICVKVDNMEDSEHTHISASSGYSSGTDSEHSHNGYVDDGDLGDLIEIPLN